MGQFYIEFFKPRHFAVVDIFIIFFHIFEVSLRPFALPLFQRNIVYGELFVTKNIGGVNNIESGVFDFNCKGNIFRNDKRETARFLVAFAAYRHTVSDKSICSVKVFDDLHGCYPRKVP